MYIAKLTYEVNEEVKVVEFEARECYANINAYGGTCHMVLPLAGATTLEEMAANHNPIQLMELYDEADQLIYNSIYWNRVDGVNSQYPAEGEPRCEVYFTHAKPEAEVVPNAE